MTLSPDRPQIALRGLGKGGHVRAAVVVLNGAKLAELRRAAALTGTLAHSCLLVAVDGGLKTCLRGKHRPDLFVGDLDSGRRPPVGVPAAIYPRDKEFSDLSAALTELHQRKVRLVGIAGLLGGRLDHEWGNLFEVGGHSPRFAGLLAPTERGTVVVTSHGCDVVTIPDRTLSLFALGGGAVVTLRGARWELKRHPLSPGSRGLSNVSGTLLDLSVHRGTVALVFVPPPPRRRTAASR